MRPIEVGAQNVCEQRTAPGAQFAPAEVSKPMTRLRAKTEMIEDIATGLDVCQHTRVETVKWAADSVEITMARGDTFRAKAAVTTLRHGVLRAGSVRFNPALPAA